MKEIKEKVGPLKKITLSWEAGRTSDYMDLTSGPKLFEFIYGLGPAGLSPFEYDLADKVVGDTINIRVKRDQIPEKFEHLEPLLFGFPMGYDTFYLRIKVIKINPADQKEVIKAMAETASCGDNCCGH
jgi:hypothetical protein